MATRKDVETFLNQFRVKVNTFDMIVSRNNGKNLDTFAELEIGDGDVKQIIFSLNPDDYYRGPTSDPGNPQWKEYWEFGKTCKNQEIYIKLSYGGFNKKALCISFHKAEYTITYPLRM